MVMPRPRPKFPKFIVTPGINSFNSGFKFKCLTNITKAGLVRVCEDLAVFAGPGNRFEPGDRCIRWVERRRLTSAPLRAHREVPGPFCCKEFRFTHEGAWGGYGLKRDRIRKLQWPDMEAEKGVEGRAESISELWRERDSEVLLKEGKWYATCLVALDGAPEWEGEEVCMVRDALELAGAQVCRRRIMQLRYKPPREVLEAGLENE